MGANSFGEYFRITTFGESHGPAGGVVVDGCPAGIPFDQDLLEKEMARRRPGSSHLVSSRNEPDQPRVLSGVHQGLTLGTPIAIMIENKDARPVDYEKIATNPRPGHADDLWQKKYGHVDPRGGGRASGRETAARVAGGAVARMVGRAICPDIIVSAYASRIGPLELSPSEAAGQAVQDLLQKAKAEGLSYGGLGEVSIKGAPVGLGRPVFNKLKADLASAYMGIGTVVGVEFGAGFAVARAEGTDFHDPKTSGAQYGGIRGGLATGEPITVRVACKPPASVLETARQGRHDPCVLLRALPVMEAMTWLVLTDHLLARGQDRV